MYEELKPTANVSVSTRKGKNKDRIMQCIYWARAGECPIGNEKCRYLHCRNGIHTPTKAYPAGTDISKAVDLKTVPCHYFASEKGCQYGDQCPLKHDTAES